MQGRVQRPNLCGLQVLHALHGRLQGELGRLEEPAEAAQSARADVRVLTLVVQLRRGASRGVRGGGGEEGESGGSVGGGGQQRQRRRRFRGAEGGGGPAAAEAWPALTATGQGETRATSLLTVSALNVTVHATTGVLLVSS
jgi:hypothetical protein